MKKYSGFLIIAILLLPSVLSIRSFIIQETEKISLAINIEDPDNDALLTTYSAPLDKNGEWQTTYGDAGNYTVIIAVYDGENNVSEQAVIFVTKKEEPPVIKSFSPVKGVLEINENENLNFEVTATDINKDNLSYSWYVDGSFISKSKKFTYGTTSDSEGEYIVSVIVSDGKFEADHSWIVKVADVDNPPEFKDIPYKEINENEEVIIEIQVSDADGDDIYVSSPNMPKGAVLEGDKFIWRPGYDAIEFSTIKGRILNELRFLSKTYTVNFIAKSKNSSSEAVAVIKVNDVNRAPILEDLPQINVKEGETFHINPTAYDPDGLPVKISYSGWTSSSSYTPGYEDQGIHYVKVTASDGLLQTSKFVQINVENVNIPPQLENIPKSFIKEGEELTIGLNGWDIDNDKLTFLAISQPENSTLESNIFTWTPSFDTVKEGSKIIALGFSVSDGKSSANRTALVDVKNINRKPEIIDIAPKDIEFKVNTPIIFSVNAIDGDSEEMSYKWDFGLFDKYEGSSIHKRTFTSKGDKKIKVVVSDDKDKVEHEWDVKIV